MPSPTTRFIPRPVALVAGLGLALALGSTPTQAGTLAGLKVYDRTSGETLPIYRHQGRSYVAGVPGHAYELSLTNKTDGRLLAIVSVDGVNAMSGETAGTDQRGYVFAPFETDHIKGWRKSLESVARFTFASLPDSYAARTGRPENVGVIGVALFRENVPSPPEEDEARPERPLPPPYPPMVTPAPYGAARAAPAPAPMTPPPSAEADTEAGIAMDKTVARQRLGTGHGRRIYDHIDTTTFERASSTPDEVLTIYYDSRSALVARGIVPRYSPPRYGHAPEAFPGGFVPDP